MLLTPIILFVILMILLYVPPVQNFIRKQATAIASDATGMNISVERIDLRFPLNLLVRGVQVVQPGSDTADIQHPDTLLNLGSLNVRVQAWPLLKGRVEVDDITLQRVAVNSSGLLEGMRIKGTLGRFFLASHGIDLNKEDAVLNRVELSDTHVQVMLADTTETPEDTTETALNWRVALHNLKLKNVSVDLQMPLDSMSLAATIGDASIEDAEADLKRQFYGWRKFALTGTSVNYDTGTAVPAEGFDASHIALRDIRIGIDSVMTCGRDMNAVIREFSMYDRSGLTVTSLTGRLFADSAVIRVPYLQLKTPHSEMNLTAQTYWKLVDIPTTGQLSARFNANIGKQDVLLFAGGLPETFKEAYPFRPLIIHAGTEGNLKQMQISRFTAELPGAFSLSGGGELVHAVGQRGDGLADAGVPDSARIDPFFQIGVSFLEREGVVGLGAETLVVPAVCLVFEAWVHQVGVRYVRLRVQGVGDSASQCSCEQCTKETVSHNCFAFKSLFLSFVEE